MIGTVPVLGGEHTQAARLQVPVHLVDGDHETLGRVVPAEHEALGRVVPARFETR